MTEWEGIQKLGEPGDLPLTNIQQLGNAVAANFDHKGLPGAFPQTDTGVVTMKNLILRGFVALTTIAASSSAALAHHPMAGKTPSNMMEGLLSGIGHPVLGMDHLAFVFAMGVQVLDQGSIYISSLPATRPSLVYLV